MKTNLFGEAILQPEDHIDDVREYLGDTPFEANLSKDEAVGWSGTISDEAVGWSGTISDANGTEVQFHDFKSEEAAREWLGGLGDDLTVIHDFGA